MTSHKFHVLGMHCESCSILIEEELRSVPGVNSVSANYKIKEVIVTGDFDEQDLDELAKEFTKKVREYGYIVTRERGMRGKRVWTDFKLAIPFAILFIGAFVVLQKLGIVNLVPGGEITLTTAFFVGIIASLSTCMAVVGGLLLSVSASFAKEGATTKPQLMFHFGRLLGFLILGGLIGALGSAFQLGATAHLLIGIGVAFIMVILGLNLLDVFPFVEKMQLTLPVSFSKQIIKHAKFSNVLAPFLIGVSTFFLPCGFTQSMQLYALSTGNYVSGALFMFVFALGTLPVLSLLSFGSMRINKSKYAGVFYKTVGIVVIAFALFNFMNVLVVAGFIQPIFSL